MKPISILWCRCSDILNLWESIFSYELLFIQMYFPFSTYVIVLVSSILNMRSFETSTLLAHASCVKLNYSMSNKISSNITWQNGKVLSCEKVPDIEILILVIEYKRLTISLSIVTIWLTRSIKIPVLDHPWRLPNITNYVAMISQRLWSHRHASPKFSSSWEPLRPKMSPLLWRHIHRWRWCMEKCYSLFLVHKYTILICQNNSNQRKTKWRTKNEI